MTINKYGLFVGFASLPPYANKENNVRNFEKHVIGTTFKKYRQEINNIFKPHQSLDKELYVPVNFYAFGHFNLISISFIDDFHFGTFSYRPFNRYISDQPENSNFQYQISNGFDLLPSKKSISLASIKKSPFIGISKIKISSALLIGNGTHLIDIIKSKIAKKISELDPSLDFIVSESFSWNEITLIFFSNALSKIITAVNQLRFETIFSFGLKDYIKDSIIEENEKNKEVFHVFSDTETIYGCNSGFFKKQSGLDIHKYDFSADDKLQINSRIQIKTGHANELTNIIHGDDCKKYISSRLNIVNGSSDYTFTYKNEVKSGTNALKNYFQFWEEILPLHSKPPKSKQQKKSNELSKSLLGNHIRKIHSNVSLEYQSKSDGGTSEYKPNSQKNLNTKIHSNLFDTLKFSFDEIRDIEKALKALKISKNIANTIISLFINFNEVICDINLYIYYMDLRSLLVHISNFLEALAYPKKNKIFSAESRLDYRSVNDVQTALMAYTEIFKNAYNNRYQNSKKHGNNSDVKLEFNGGVHQILHTYDSIFKIVYKNFRLTDKNVANEQLPVVSYGSYETGIKSSIVNLHLDYFQLFQPEFFAFSLTKEAANFLFSRPMLTENDSGEMKFIVDWIVKLRTVLANLIHDETNSEYKKLLYEFLPPQNLKEKLNYISNYVFFLSSYEKKDIDTFCYWLWFTYLQDSRLYNIDGSLSIRLFKESFFAYYTAMRRVAGDDFINKKWFLNIISVSEIEFYLGNKDVNIFDRCEKLYDYLFIPDDNEVVEKNQTFDLTTDVENAIENLQYKNASRKILISILDVVANMSVQMKQASLLDKNEDKAFLLRLMEISTKFLSSVRKDFTKDSKNKILMYQRELTGGIGKTQKIDYAKAIFDPLGGVFVIDNDLRLAIMKKRLNLLNEYRDISLKYKKTFVKNAS